MLRSSPTPRIQTRCPSSRRRPGLGVLGALVLASACGPAPVETAYQWKLPLGFVEPRVPSDNPMSEAKVELGRHLFHDKRLSLNQTQACASCHQPAKAFTDGKPKAVGSTGRVHLRGALSLSNAGWRATYNWANSLLRTLEQQALVPLFNVDPIPELAMDGREDVLLARLSGDAVYPGLFAEAYPDATEPVISMGSTVRALVSFVRTIVSGNSAYDRYRNGDPSALSEAAKRGMNLFYGKANCSLCHSGITFTDAEYRPDLLPSQIPFHNEGLSNVDGLGGSPAQEPGLAVQTGAPDDVGRFRTPTLRNIALTAPYMHDGSLPTLADVIAHYADPFALDAAGQRVAASPRRDTEAQGIVLSPDERLELEAFLEALTDEDFLTDPRYVDPFVTGAP